MTHYHASAASFEGQGLLLCGQSGSGKSALLLRLIDRGFDLVADDRVVLTQRDERLFVSPPEQIQGLLEIRGQGIYRLPFVAEVPLALLVQLDDSPLLPRLPEAMYRRLHDLALPQISLDPHCHTAVGRIRAALLYERAA